MDVAAMIYPTLLTCGLFAIILGVGIACSYVWLIFLDRQFRKCPHCQAKGTGYIIEREVLRTQNHMDYKPTSPVRVTVKTIEDRYQCENCRHRWTKTVEETVRKPVRM